MELKMYKAEVLQARIDKRVGQGISDVRSFATQAHKGVMRKFGEGEYINHPIRVSQNFSDPRQIKVALLHDVVEDTDYSIDTIILMFGLEVGTGVEWLTDASKVEGQNRAQRVQENSDRLSQAPNWVKAIKTADIIDNLPSIIEHDPDFAKIFVAEKKITLDKMTYLKGTPWSYLSIKAYAIIDDYYKEKENGS